MNCQEFWNTMPELEPGADDGGLDHARGCPSCAALLQQQRTLVEGLRAVRPEWRREEAPRRLEGRLTSAFRSHNGLAARRSFAWAPLLTWAAASAAIILLAMFLLRGRPPEPAQRRVPSRLQYANLQVPDAMSGLDALYTDAGFMPLPNAAEIEPNEVVNYVRVEVPRSRMIALGLPVNADRASELVQAEVVLGADGLARAVRFLDE